MHPAAPHPLLPLHLMSFAPELSTGPLRQQRHSFEQQGFTLSLTLPGVLPRKWFGRQRRGLEMNAARKALRGLVYTPCIISAVIAREMETTPHLPLSLKGRGGNLRYLVALRCAAQGGLFGCEVLGQGHPQGLYPESGLAGRDWVQRQQYSQVVIPVLLEGDLIPLGPRAFCHSEGVLPWMDDRRMTP
jgi:hypothetical protein